MTFVDTHTHLYLPEFEGLGCDAVRRALDAGVGKMLFPNVDLTTIGPMRELNATFPQVTYMAMGLHPTEVNEGWREALAIVVSELERNANDYVAVGEIGIDLYWDKTFREEQMEAFAEQCRKASEMGLPVIIHCREGLSETLEVLSAMENPPKAVFHSFGGMVEDVRSIRRVGDFYFGINGIVTFKNSRLREVLPEIGADRILLETDSPYLAPVPHRGKRNESAYLPSVATTVADALGMSIEEIASKTTANAVDLFGLTE